MKSSFKQNEIKKLVCLAIIGMIAFGIGFLLIGQIPEKYYDVISEILSGQKGNKSLELKMFWIITALGIVYLLVRYILTKIKRVKLSEEKVLTKTTGSIIFIITASLISYALTSNIPFILVAALFIILVANNTIKDKEFKVLTASAFIYYSIYSFLVLINFFIKDFDISNDLVLLVTTIISFIIIYIEKNKNILDKVILLSQSTIPIIMLQYLLNRYLYHGNKMYLQLPIAAKIFFFGLLFIFLIYNIIFIIKRWEADDKSTNNLISIATIIVIFIFNSVDTNTSIIMPTDLHHKGEDILSFQQIFALGQTPYLKYIPVSGLFSTLSGLVLEILGGKLVYCNVAFAIYQMIFAIITIILVTRHINKNETLLFVMLFNFPIYNRTFLIVVSLLILLLPKLIQNKNLWLKIWIWLVFLGGLYYPTYGAAMLVGTLPYGIIQLITYLKSDKFRVDIKKPIFYITWILTMIPIILSIPMLINIAKHVLIYSEQTTYADGVAVFSQPVADNVLNILNFSETIKRLAYYSIRYLIPTLGLWTFTLLIIQYFNGSNKSECKKKIKKEQFLAIISCLGIMLCSYTYTLVRADFGVILQRTGYIIVLLCGMMLFIILTKYFKQTKSVYIILGLWAGIIMTLNLGGNNNLDQKIRHVYEVSDEFELVTNSKLPRVGKGFVSTGEYTTLINKNYTMKDIEKLYDNAQKLLKYDKNLNFVLYGCLGIYYLNDMPTVGQPSIHAIKDLKTSNELIEIIKKYKPVVGRNITSEQQNYYIYHWLMTTDEYIYSEEYEAFLPKELYKKIYKNDNNSKEKRLKAGFLKSDLGTSASVFGNSYDTLKNIFITNKVKYTKKCGFEESNKYTCNYNFDKSIKGVDADFIYLDIETNRNNYNQKAFNTIIDIDKTNSDIKVTLSWKEKSVNCILYQGKLLVEIGANSDWLLNNHDDLKVTIDGIPEEQHVSIKDIKFLKLDVDRK